eukprot:1498985-Prymnesium_polylepis.1
MRTLRPAVLHGHVQKFKKYDTREDTQTRSTAWACKGNNTRCVGTVRNSKLVGSHLPGERLRVHVIHEDTSHDACTWDGGGGQSGMEPPRPSDGGGGYSTDGPSDGGGGQATDRQCMTAT